MSIEQSVQRVKDALLARSHGRTFFLPNGLVDGLATATGESALTVRQCLGRLAKSGWIDGVADDGTPLRRVKILGAVPPTPSDPALERWQSVLSRSTRLGNDERSMLLPLWPKLAELGESEMESVLVGLLALRDQLVNERGRSRYVVSAKYLLGSAKMLDSLAGPYLRKFGLDGQDFPSHPRYVVVAGCEEPRAVVLVENPAAFELAVRTRAVETCAFIVTFGFGLGREKDDFGKQLAEMVDDRFSSAITLRRDGSNCPSAQALLAHPRITFWGDLDIAGLRIYEQLKRYIPLLSLSAIYKPMIKALESNERSHRYMQVVGKAGQAALGGAPRGEVVNPLDLMNVCAAHGVDQESVAPHEIEEHCGQSLSAFL